jgi:hypothetical protein
MITSSKNIFGKGGVKLKSGTLRIFGYHVKDKINTRRLALVEAIKKLGVDTVIKKLNAVKILTKNTNPSISNKFSSDVKWLSKVNSIALKTNF